MSDQFKQNKRGYRNDANMESGREFDTYGMLIRLTESNHTHNRMALGPLNRAFRGFDFTEGHQIHQRAARVLQAMFCGGAAKRCIGNG